MTNRWFSLTIFLSILLGLSKAHHFIRLVILGGLGLAGLWMVHTLAQDFNLIQSSSGSRSNDGEELKIFKRSLYEGNAESPKINWEFVLSRDPASCARSFICQLAAENENLLTTNEKNILEITRNSAETDSWASKQLHEALRNGEKLSKPSQCMKIYKFCPYSSRTMMTLLQVFGR